MSIKTRGFGHSQYHGDEGSQKRREIASKGGTVASHRKASHRWTPEEARKARKKVRGKKDTP